MKNTQKTRLNSDLLDQLGNLNMQKRDESVPASIVHLGIGAFHRAHQAVYTHNANVFAVKSGQPQWYIIGVSLRSDAVQQQLAPQDCYYSVLETDVSGNSVSMVNSIKQVLVAPQNPQAVLDAMTAASTKIISLTVTEKGYCHDPASGNLNLQHPDIKHDLANINKPISAIGYITSALQTRMKMGIPAPSILCCDNLPSNGDSVKEFVLQFARVVDHKLASWIATEVSFPNTMVDRIVPATTQQDVQNLAAQQGYLDLGMVKTERFSQWVIEDNFVAGRPQWEAAGATIVEDVARFEHAKLRLLNGSHSSIAYLGCLLGYEYVHQVVEDVDLLYYLRHMMKQEITPTIAPPEGLDIAQYCDNLLLRFANPALNHRTAQIAMDGSQKVPQRLLFTIQNQLEHCASIECLSFAIAAWLRYTMGFNEKGDLLEIQDPLAAELSKIHKQYFNNIDELITAYLSFDRVFSETLASSSYFQQRLKHWLGTIVTKGTAPALKVLLMDIHSDAI